MFQVLGPVVLVVFDAADNPFAPLYQGPIFVKHILKKFVCNFDGIDNSLLSYIYMYDIIYIINI